MSDIHIDALAHAAAMATMAEQLKTVAEGVQRSERKLEKLDEIGTTVAELRVAIALKAETAALASVNSKVENWIGHFRGALIVASIFFGTIQTAMIGGISYVVTHVSSNETAIAILAQRIASIERANPRREP